MPVFIRRNAHIIITISIIFAALTAAFALDPPERVRPRDTDIPAVITIPNPNAVNINTATAVGLCQLDGIPYNLALAIVEYRETHGPFEHIAQLTRIKGIGMGIFEQVRDWIRVE